MYRRRSLKILATLGPATSTPEAIAALVEAGADAFRLNMSHGTHEGVAKLHAAIRQVEAEKGHPIGILADLQGPKLRIGKVASGEAMLEEGAHLRLDLDTAPGDARRLPLPHPEIFKALEAGATLLLNDGKIRLRVIEAGDGFAETEIVVGGPISNNKGVNVPDAVLPVAALSDKDRRDLDFAANLGVDWIALSFVQRPEDVAEAKKLTAGRAALMAKIEKPAAVARIDEILEVADGLMVARGDLGVEMPLEKVPGIQKSLIRLARHAGKPVVVATQMLESMIENPVPTRAEVSDVAGAVYDGADAVMLSAESAVGAYPVEAVSTMDRVARSVEGDSAYRSAIHSLETAPEATSADAITAAARQVAETIGAAAIVCYTKSGSTGLRAARERPAVPIVCLTPLMETARRLALVWGLHCVLTDDAENFRDMVVRASRIVQDQGFAEKRQRIVITAGVPFGTPGATNILRIAQVGSPRGIVTD
ncbi:pyruvate kinase [Futiania mangrovi]|uniref:Pyruvate kinase n=1 Tax=Futiania mangrovi TaxID=2959716 RepID=A0A9J6P9D5_9PROT|nr:pyruvate kinase [Futiania mangrovii]MCP1334841.1 pyruvate kinase [Futiania mangrovii]